MKAKDHLREYFHQSQVPAQASRTAKKIPGLELRGSTLTIECGMATTFRESRFAFDALEIKDISHLLIKGKKSFINFLQENGVNVTQLEFSYGSLKFESLNEILQKLPNLKTIQFHEVEYKVFKTKPTIQPDTCQNLIELKIVYNKESKFLLSNLLHAFQKCKTIQKLTVSCIELPLYLLQLYTNLQELTVNWDSSLPVNEVLKLLNSRFKQLTVLNITMKSLYDETSLKKCLSFIKNQRNLQQFFYNSIYSQPQSFCEPLASHICQLEHLTSLQISGDKKLQQEVEAFAANSRLANTRLEELKCEIRNTKSLPSTFLGLFTNLRKLDINLYEADEIKVADSLSFLNKTRLT